MLITLYSITITNHNSNIPTDWLTFNTHLAGILSAKRLTVNYVLKGRACLYTTLLDKQPLGWATLYAELAV